MTTIEDYDMESQPKNRNPFIAKLYFIINSDEPTVRWVPGGERFLILNPKKFSQTVLPKYFKHSKFTSFVRQLNFYGFHKKRITMGDLEKNKNTGSNNAGNDAPSDLAGAVCFQHEYFQANQPKLIARIQRTTRQPSAIAAAEELSQTRQKEIEGIHEQLREMKQQMDSTNDEFEVKLAAARAEIELDYLHRIREIEVCYKDLVTMILRNKELSSEFPLQGREKPRFVSYHETSPSYPRPASRSVRNNSRNTSTNRSNSVIRSILLGQSYTAGDYSIEQKLDMLPRQHQNNGSRRISYDDLEAKSNRVYLDILVGAATKHLLPNEKEIAFEKNGFNKSKVDDGMLVGSSLSHILRRNKQMLAHSTTGKSTTNLRDGKFQL